MKAQIRFGIIDSVEGGRARVRLQDDDIVTALLPVAQVSTRSNKWVQMPAVGDQVAAVMDENIEDGCIVGAIYSGRDEAPEGVEGVEYATGARMVYHPSTGRWSIDSNAESLAAVLTDLITQIEILTVGTAVGPSTPPINLAAFTAIKARLQLLLQ